MDAGRLQQVEVEPGRSSLSDPPDPDPWVGTFQTADGKTAEFAADGTGRFVVPDRVDPMFGGSVRGGTQDFYWARDLTRPDHVHLIERNVFHKYARPMSIWGRRSVGADGRLTLAPAAPGTSWMNVRPGLPSGEFGKPLEALSGIEWRFDPDGTGAFRRPYIAVTGDPADDIPECGGRFTWRDQGTAVVTVTEVSDPCLYWSFDTQAEGPIELQSFRFGDHIYFDGSRL